MTTPTVETNLAKRWLLGTPHHPKSVELFKAIAALDFEFNNDSFCWKSGGDGDNGEAMMFLMDIYFERQDVAGNTSPVKGP